VVALEAAVKGDDKATIEAKVEELSKVSAPVAQKMYAEQANRKRTVLSQARQTRLKKHDDVVDAEFEEVKDRPEVSQLVCRPVDRVSSGDW
jgi:molecular chaperone DnaK